MTGRTKERSRSVARYVDGEMGRDEAVAFEARLRESAALRAAVEELRALRRLFAPERAADGPLPGAGFRARVLAAAAAPGPAEAPVAEVWGRRVLAAAAAVVAATILLAVAVLRRADTGRLEASPAELQRTMDQLDARIRAAETRAGGAEGR